MTAIKAIKPSVVYVILFSNYTSYIKQVLKAVIVLIYINWTSMCHLPLKL